MLQVLCIAISTACLIAPAFGQSFLVSMGQLPDLYPTGTVLSADGSTVFANFQGNDVQEAYRWRLGEGFTPVPRLTNYRGSAVGASSADGSRFCGLVQDSPSPINTSPAVWRNGMNGPPELNHTVFYSLRAMSRDGSTWAGDENPVSIHRNGVPVPLAPQWGDVRALSSDGSVAAGRTARLPGQTGRDGAFVWSQTVGMRWIDGPPGDAIGEVRTLSAAGDVGAGLRWRMEGQNQVDHRVYLWSEAAGIQVLPLPRDGLRPVTSMRLTADAAMLGVLFSTPSPAGTTYESWLYSTATQNWSRLEDHFTRAGISTAGWEGFRLGGISDDGLTFTGVAFLQGQYQHFYARVPAPAALCLPALAGMLFVRRRVRPIAGA